MKIGIDIRTAGGEKAGKGWYTFHLTYNLLKIDTENKYILYAKEKIPGFEEFKNAKLSVVKGYGILWHHKVARDAKREEVDVFFAPSSYITPTFLAKKIKVIVTVHDLVAFLFPDTHNKKATVIEKLFLNKAMKRADHVLTISKNTKRDIRAKFKINEEKISIAYCSGAEEFKPIPKEKLKPFIAKTHLPKKFFLAVGTIIPRKNYLNLIKAFAKISEKYPDYHLIIVGKKGWDFEEVFEEIHNSYLKKNVHVLGYLSNKSLIGLYNLATAFVFPSLYEGFGIPPLEAMKCGCPVIASYSSSIPEVVGDAALMIDPKNPSEIAGAMKKLIENEDLREKLISAGFTQSKKFSWKASATKLLEIIEKL